METELFKLVHPHMQLYSTRTNKSEWYAMTNAQLKKYFTQVHEMFPNTTLPITKWMDPFVHHFVDEGVDIEVSDRPITGMTQGRDVEGKRKIKVKNWARMKFT